MTAAARLKSYIERIERNREEKRALTEHERDIFAEIKGAGFDAKAIRKVLQRRAMGDAAVAELDALVDAYEAALGGKSVAVALMRAGDSPRQAAKKAGIGEGTARRAKNLISGAPAHDPETGEITETDRVATSGAPERPAAQGGESLPPRRDPIPESPAGAAPSEPATDRAQVAALTPPSAVPAGEPDPDEHWEKRDGEGNYMLALQVANGKVPHPADVSHVVPVRPDTTAIDDGLTIPPHLRVGTEANRIARRGR